MPSAITSSVLDRVVVGEQAEADAAVVAHDRDRERVVLGQEGDREDLLHLPSEHVERQLRPGHVGDDQVEEPGREVDPRGLREQGRRGEVVEAGDHFGAQRLLGALQALHLLADDPQPPHRVLDVDGQRPAHHRDLVAEVAALVLGADRDRHQGAQLEPLGADPAAVQPLAQGAGDDGEHDVVDGAAEGVLDPFEGRQLRARPDEAPVRADLLVERHVGRRVGEGADELAEPLEASAIRRAVVSGLRTASIARSASLTGAAATSVAARVDQGRGARLRPRRPVVDAARPASGTGSRSKRTVPMSTPETPSTIAWWVLVRIAKRSRSRPCTSHSSQSGFERSSCCEKTRAASRLQLLLAARLRQPGVADVVGEVEVDVVGPERPAGLERRHDDALAEARHQAEPAAHVLDEVDVERRRPLEDQDRADVHVAGGASRWSGTRRRRRSAGRDGFRRWPCCTEG